MCPRLTSSGFHLLCGCFPHPSCPADKMVAVAKELESTQDHLSQLRIKPVEENRVMLMFEKSLVSLVENENPEQPLRITVKTKRFLGTLTISLTVPGKEFPFSQKVIPLGLHLEEEGKVTRRGLCTGLSFNRLEVGSDTSTGKVRTR